MKERAAVILGLVMRAAGGLVTGAADRLDSGAAGGLDTGAAGGSGQRTREELRRTRGYLGLGRWSESLLRYVGVPGVG